MPRRKQPKRDASQRVPELPTPPALASANGSAADSDGEEMPKEQEALAAGLALVDAKWDGESDFDKGMRLLQQKLGIKR